ncbi:MAG TPA: MarR family transcriptional regulator [Candidatus Angelobacter sp.]|jgi:DNA-binding MarR family transcriptional regulator|nr:MarR family transcriptional regulator [Candidatus Angelobacter sp.]
MARATNSKAAVAAEAWKAIFDFIIATASQRNRYLGETGLTPNDARTLQSLSSSEGRSMSDLADEWKLDASTVTWIVDRLEAKGLVQRRPHPSDRRSRLVILTTKGARLMAKNTERMYIPPPELLDLDLSELIALRDAVRKLPGQQQSRA